MRRLLPIPTPQDIEAALAAIRDGTSAYGRWVRLDDHLDNYDEVNAEADRLWWVTIIDPEGTEEAAIGGGTSLSEAVAVAWINTRIRAWWSRTDLSDEDYAKVPRHVGGGWQFELHRRPVRPVLTIIEGSRPSGAG